MEPKVPKVVIPRIKPEKKKEPVIKTEEKEASILIPQEEAVAAESSPDTKETETAKDPEAISKIELPDVSESPTKPFLSPLTKKILLGVGIFFVVLIVALGVPGFLLIGKTKTLMAQGKALADAAKTSNIPAVKAEIGKTKTAVASFRSTFVLLSWTKFIPWAGAYVRDVDRGTKALGYGLEAAEITIGVVEPYADVLGISTGAEVKDGTKTAQERIDFIAQAIPTILPKIDEIMDKAGKAKAEIDQINPDRYPLKFQGREIREPMRQAIGTFDEAISLVANSKPLLEAAPYLLGLDEERQYLLLFQNDKELRPTGGFMTAYAVMKVNKAKFDPVSSNDIYNLDAQYKPHLETPDPIVKYIKGPYILSKSFRLRDMNWSPDFSVSMDLFAKEISGLGIKNIDGIIAVDTGLLTNLLDAIGPIGVPGFGNFSTKIEPKCNCPQVIYELESFADVEGPIIWDPLTGKIILRPANSDNRKKIIGPLMNSILANAMGQPKEKLPALAGAALKSLLEKHVLFYLNDDNAQAGVTSFGAAGRILGYDGDYLHINDANLGGRKSNLYVTQEVEQVLEVKDGAIEKTLTITYKNPMKQDGWLNSVLPNWVRIYVPKGSTLITMEGVEDKAEPYEEFGKTVFAGYFELRPEGVAKVTVKYKLPFGNSKNYKLLVQKQPGTDAPLYTIKYGRKTEEQYLKQDKEFRFSF
jgi:hypothetical protein